MSLEINEFDLAGKWFAAGEWTNGLHIKIHESVNVPTFFAQYNKNRKYWDQAFAYLRDTDLDNIAPGKYMLDGNHVYVLVSEANTKAIEDTKWEAHIKYIDLQYVARGSEKIGVAPLSMGISTTPFDTDKDIGFYEVPEANCKYYVAEPGTFFIFFPQDAHRPCIKIKGTDSNKKIVVKIKVR